MMKTRTLFALPLAAALLLPAAAQQNTDPFANATPVTAESAQPSQTGTQATREPLKPVRQGFWGKLNPFARKKYVEKQVGPVRDRANELGELTDANGRAITDLDKRSSAALRAANDRAALADQRATDADGRALAAGDTAQRAGTRLAGVEQVVGNLDQYEQTNQVALRFRTGTSQLSKTAQESLDDMAESLKDKRGYVIEVQGFAPGKGQAAIAQSKAQADAVVRYLVIKHQVPVYRIFELGMGNAAVPGATAKSGHAQGARVEVTLLKNSLEQLDARPAAGSQTSSLGTPR